MNIREIEQLISNNNMNAIENVWMDAMEQNLPLAKMQQIIAAVADAKKTEEAQTLGAMYISEAAERLDDQESLETVRAIMPSMPGDEETRSLAVSLYQKVYGDSENFADFLKESGWASSNRQDVRYERLTHA